MLIGDHRTRAKYTGQLFISDAVGNFAYTNFGNVLSHKVANKLDRTPWVTAKKGYVQETHEEISKARLGYEIKLDEHALEAKRLMSLSTSGADVVQTSSSGVTFSQASVVLGLSYYVGAMGLSAFVATGLTLDVDYTIDLGSGMITILTTGSVAAGATVAGTFTRGAYTFKTTTSLTKLLKRGQVKIVQFDQNTELPRNVLTFVGEAYISDWGDNDGQKVNDFTLMILACGPVTETAIEL